MKRIIFLLALILMLAPQTALAADDGPGNARSVAVSTICAFTGPASRDCTIARDWTVRYFAYVPGMTEIGRYHWGTKLIEMAWPLPQDSFTQVLYHEAQHAKDDQDGIGLAESEERAVIAQTAIIQYILGGRATHTGILVGIQFRV